MTTDLLVRVRRDGQDVAKHADHDQETHGNWARSVMGNDAAARITRLFTSSRYGETKRENAHNAAWIAPDGRLVGDKADHQDSAREALTTLGEKPSEDDWQNVARIVNHGFIRLNVAEHELNTHVSTTITQEQRAAISRLMDDNPGIDLYYDIQGPDPRFVLDHGSSIDDLDRDVVTKHADHDQETHGNWADGTPKSGFAHVPASDFVTERDRSTQPWFLSHQTADELDAAEAQVSLGGPGNKVGYAIDRQGDFGNLFNNSGVRGAGRAAIVRAIEGGAKTLDCYQSHLPGLYARYGYEEVARLRWKDEYAPKGWPTALDSPDVVVMAYRGGDRATISSRVGTFRPYEPGTNYLDDIGAAKALARGAVRDRGVAKDARGAVGERPLGAAQVLLGVHPDALARTPDTRGVIARARRGELFDAALFKHGDHDQSSHGDWAHGIAGRRTFLGGLLGLPLLTSDDSGPSGESADDGDNLLARQNRKREAMYELGYDPSVRGGPKRPEHTTFTPSNVLVREALKDLPPSFTEHFADRHVSRPASFPTEIAPGVGGQFIVGPDGNVDIAVGRGNEDVGLDPVLVLRHELLHAYAIEDSAFASEATAGYPALREASGKDAAALNADQALQRLPIMHGWGAGDSAARGDWGHVWVALADAYIRGVRLPPHVAAYFAPLGSGNVKKHGDHDQESHGNWVDGVARTKASVIDADTDWAARYEAKHATDGLHLPPEHKVWWHGSPGGDLGSDKPHAIHIGTREAARQALEARIGTPAVGEWDGTREYGKTLLAARSQTTQTGYNSDAPDKDHYPTGAATYSDGTPIPMSERPSIFPVRIVGNMTNTPRTAHEDFKANGYIAAQLKRGTAKSGYYYENVGEDAGSISVVVPSTAHLERLAREPSIEKHANHDQSDHGNRDRQGTTATATPLSKPRALPRSLGISRKDMPQIRESDQAEFADFARKKGVTIKTGLAPLHDLRSAQDEWNPRNVANMPPEALKKPALISRDNYVLDGTHRWLRLLRDEGPTGSMPVLRIDLPARAALDLMRAFPKAGSKDVGQAGPTPVAASVDGGWEKFATVTLMPEIMDLLKHGSHDQEDHGNWADGTASTQAPEIRSVARQIASAPRARPPKDIEREAAGGGLAAKKFVERELHGFDAKPGPDESQEQYQAHGLWNEEQSSIIKESVVQAIGSAIDPNEWEAVGQRLDVEHGRELRSPHRETRDVLANWSETAADSDPSVVAFQLSAAKVLGASPSSANAVYRAYMKAGDPAWSQQQDREILDHHIADRGKANELIVRAMYENTQKELVKHGIKQVTLYRGMALPEGREPEWVRKNSVGEITQYPLSSWTSESDVARDFARTAASEVGPGTGFVLAATFPSERVVSTPRSGIGALSEYEFIVAGDLIEAKAEVVWGGDDDIGKSAFAKHGTHDQKEHGNWARGIGAQQDAPTRTAAPIAAEPQDLGQAINAARPEIGHAYMRVSEFENAHRNDDIESLIAVSRDGAVKLAAIQTGMESRVEIKDEDLPLLRGTVLSHNHPAGKALSVDDLITTRAAGIAEVRAARRGDGQTRASLTEKAREMPLSAFAIEVRAIDHDLYRSLRPHVDSGRVPWRDADAAHDDIRLMKLVSAGLVVASGVRSHDTILQILGRNWGAAA